MRISNSRMTTVYPNTLDRPPIERVLALLSPDPAHPHLPLFQSQGVQPQCVAFATVAAMMFVRKSLGLPDVLLNPLDLFGRIAQWDGQADVGDATRVSAEDGVGTQPLSTGEERSLYRATWQPCGTVRSNPREMFGRAWAATDDGHPVVISTNWRKGYRPAKDGWREPVAGGQLYGHAVLGYKPAVRLVQGVPEYGIWVRNSVGSFAPKWGHCVVMPEADLVGADYTVCVGCT